MQQPWVQNVQIIEKPFYLKFGKSTWEEKTADSLYSWI